MAINDNATLLIGSGNFFTAPTGTALPADLLAIPVAWTNVGNTSLADIFSMTSEGGDATNIGTLQNKTLRTTYATRTETIAITLMQFDKASLKLYFGSNAVENIDGTIGVPTNPTPTTCAFLAVFVDRANVFAVYAPKVEILRGDDLSISDTESLASLALAVKPLQYQTNQWAYAITPLGETP